MAHQHPPRFLKIVDDAKTRGAKILTGGGKSTRKTTTTYDHEAAVVHSRTRDRRRARARVATARSRSGNGPLLWRRFPFSPRRRQPAEDGLYQRHFDGRRHPRLARERLSARNWTTSLGHRTSDFGPPTSDSANALGMWFESQGLRRRTSDFRPQASDPHPML